MCGNTVDVDRFPASFIPIFRFIRPNSRQYSCRNVNRLLYNCLFRRGRDTETICASNVYVRGPAPKENFYSILAAASLASFLQSGSIHLLLYFASPQAFFLDCVLLRFLYYMCLGCPTEALLRLVVAASRHSTLVAAGFSPVSALLWKASLTCAAIAHFMPTLSLF